MAASYGEDPDVSLMLRVAKGDWAAFEALVTKYQKSVINAAFRYTGNPAVAEELAQDVFIRVYRASNGYRPDARFSTWLFTIVRNVCSNYRARAGRYDKQMNSEMDPSFSVSGDNPEQDLIRNERRMRIRDAVGDLPESLRMPLILNQFNHMSYDEVAKILEISLAAVKVRIHRARLALMEQLKELV